MPFFAPREPIPPFDDAWLEDAWLGASDRYVGGPVGGSMVLASTDDVAVVVHHVAIDPLGLSLRLTTVRASRPEAPAGAGAAAWAVNGDASPNGLRFAIGLAEGTVVELDDSGYGLEDLDAGEGGDEEAPSFEVRSEGGSGSGGRWDEDLRLVPTPPPGPLTLACLWPEESIDETTAVVAAEDLAAGLGSAILLWPERPLPADDAGGRWFNYSPD